MNKKQVLAAGGAAAVTLLMAVPAFAATPSVTSNSTSSSSSVSHTSKYAGWHAGTTKKTPNAAFGKITAINGSTITLTYGSKAGKVSVTVTTTDTTTYKQNGITETSSDLAVGQRVIVMGTKDSSGNITDATSVNIMVAQHAKKTKTSTTSA